MQTRTQKRRDDWEELLARKMAARQPRAPMAFSARTKRHPDNRKSWGKGGRREGLLGKKGNIWHHFGTAVSRETTKGHMERSRRQTLNLITSSLATAAITSTSVATTAITAAAAAATAEATTATTADTESVSLVVAEAAGIPDPPWHGDVPSVAVSVTARVAEGEAEKVAYSTAAAAAAVAAASA